MPETVISKMQAFPIPKMVEELQAFGLLGYWRLFVPYLAIE